MSLSYARELSQSPCLKTTEIVEQHQDSSEFPFGQAAAAAATKAAQDADTLREYERKRDCLSAAIDSTSSLVSDLRTFNKSQWTLRYPQINSSTTTTPNPSPSSPQTLRRTLSFADEPKITKEVLVNRPQGVMRSSTSLNGFERRGEDVAAAEREREEKEEFQILALDLKLGAGRNPGSLVMSLEKSSIATLLDGRMATSMKHLESLRQRILDTSSKVLVTGDLNAGKSTFVNALLRREVLPVDQQPCTTIFCTVYDARDNNGVEEVHIDKVGVTYDRKDDKTFDRLAIKDLEEMVVDADGDRPPLRVYVNDTRAGEESLIHNSVVDVALIDAPGLNRDSLKTTAVFARQEEIDVIVFVVSAANHFTLSAKEFIWNASNEKAYLFIVVNRFDQIKDKERCKRTVLDQIKQLSPRTYEEAKDLVHFVDSASIVDAAGLEMPEEEDINDNNTTSFAQLEESLRSFILDKRAKSKLLPAETFVTRLLSDIDLLASSNVIVAQEEMHKAQLEIDAVKPVVDAMRRGREGLEDGLEKEEDGVTSTATAHARARLERALAYVAKGEIAPGLSTTTTTNLRMPAYPGLLALWDYAREVKQVLLASIDAAVDAAEQEARQLTVEGINHVNELGDHYLPADVERSKRVFQPEAMFAARPQKRRQSSHHHQHSVGIVSNVGLRLARNNDLLHVDLSDLFDVHHHIARLHSSTTTTSGDSSSDSKELETTSALGLASIGLGAVTMIGGKTVGARGVIEGIVRLGELVGDKNARKWAGPIVGIFALSTAVYVVMELPRSIPRNIGRNLKKQLTTTSSSSSSSVVEDNAARVGRETRKVMRLAAWDLRERFRNAMEEKSKEVKASEEKKELAKVALEWFEKVGERTEGIREEAGWVFVPVQ